MSNGQRIPAAEKILICLTLGVLVKGFYPVSCCFASGAEEGLHRPSMPSALFQPINGETLTTTERKDKMFFLFFFFF